MKRISPYTRLLNEIKDWCYKARYRHTKLMWTYPQKSLDDSDWSLRRLNERAEAAEQLGYDVILKPTDEGLKVLYVKKLPEIPISFKY